MSAVRLLAALVAVLFAVQVALGAVRRRETPAPSDPLESIVNSLQESASQLRAQVEGLASSSNATALFDEFSRHVTQLQERVSSLAANVTQHFSAATPAP